MITIKCQRLTEDKTYEEAEIEVPAPVFKKLEGREEERKGTWDWGLAETLQHKDLLSECDLLVCNSSFDKTYEEVEIEVPEAVFKNMQGGECENLQGGEGEGTW